MSNHIFLVPKETIHMSNHISGIFRRQSTFHMSNNIFWDPLETICMRCQTVLCEILRRYEYEMSKPYFLGLFGDSLHKMSNQFFLTS